MFAPIHPRGAQAVGLQCPQILSENGSMIKKIHHTDTLVYHEGAQVFEGRDEAGGRYIGVLADSRDGVDSYVIVEVSAERLRAFHAEGPDLKSLLIEGSKDGWYLAETPNGFGDPLVLQEQSGAVVERNLTPEDDFVLGVLSYMVVQQNRLQVIAP